VGTPSLPGVSPRLVPCGETSSTAQKHEPQTWLVATVPSCCWGSEGKAAGARGAHQYRGGLGTLVHNQPVCSPSPFGLICLLAGLVIKNNFKGSRKHFIACPEPGKARGVTASFTCSLSCSESSLARWNLSPTRCTAAAGRSARCPAPSAGYFCPSRSPPRACGGRRNFTL